MKILAHLGEQGLRIAEEYARDLSALARLRAVQVLAHMAIKERHEPSTPGLSERAFARATEIRNSVKSDDLPSVAPALTQGTNFVSMDDGDHGQRVADAVDALLLAYRQGGAAA